MVLFMRKLAAICSFTKGTKLIVERLLLHFLVWQTLLVLNNVQMLRAMKTIFRRFIEKLENSEQHFENYLKMFIKSS